MRGGWGCWWWLYRPSQTSHRASPSSARASQSWPRPPQPPRAAGAAVEQLLRKNASKFVVTHYENEKSITKTHKQHGKIDNLEIGCAFSLFFMPKARKNEPIRGSSESAGSCPRTAARHLPNTRRGSGWCEFTSKLPQTIHIIYILYIIYRSSM